MKHTGQRGGECLVFHPHHIAAALNELPDPRTAAEEYHDTVINIPDVGSVRVTAKRIPHKRGRHEHWFWTAVEALRCE